MQHRSVQKHTSPPLRSPTMANVLQMDRPFDLPSSQNFTQRPPIIDLTSTPTAPSSPGGRTIQVIDHNPANNNDFTARTSYTSALCRSPYFQQQIRGLTHNNMTILHIVAELEYFEIVANWLCTNNVHTPDRSIPDLYTLINVMFLADTLQQSQLCVQVLTMIRMQQYASNDKNRTLPSYFEIYQKTSVGNPSGQFVAEAYIKSEMGKNKPRVPLIDLPAAMLVDIIILRDCSQKAFRRATRQKGRAIKTGE